MGHSLRPKLYSTCSFQHQQRFFPIMKEESAFVCQRPNISVDGGHRTKPHTGTDLPVAWGHVVLLPSTRVKIQNLTHSFCVNQSFQKQLSLLHFMILLIRKGLSQMYAVILLPEWQSENTRGSENTNRAPLLRFAIA